MSGPLAGVKVIEVAGLGGGCIHAPDDQAVGLCDRLIVAIGVHSSKKPLCDGTHKTLA